MLACIFDYENHLTKIIEALIIELITEKRGNAIAEWNQGLSCASWFNWSFAVWAIYLLMCLTGHFHHNIFSQEWNNVCPPGDVNEEKCKDPGQGSNCGWVRLNVIETNWCMAALHLRGWNAEMSCYNVITFIAVSRLMFGYGLSNVDIFYS